VDGKAPGLFASTRRSTNKRMVGVCVCASVCVRTPPSLKISDREIVNRSRFFTGGSGPRDGALGGSDTREEWEPGESGGGGASD
jgi:hypothetical protein